MPQLDINGTRINIGDEFLKLSPQDQDAFVKNTIVPSAEFQAAQKIKPAVKAEAEKPGVISELGKAFSPTEIARETGRTASEGLEKIEALKDRSKQGTFEGLGTTAKAVLGAGEIAAAPIVGPARAIGGHLLTAAEMAAGRGLSAITGRDLTAKEPSPEAMYETARGDIDTAAMAARPVGTPTRLPILPGGPRIGPFETPGYRWQQPPPPLPPQAPAPPPPGTPLQEMGRQAGIELPRALTGTPFQQQAAQALAKQTAVGGGQIGTALEDVPVQLARRRGEIAAELGPERLPENIGGDIRSTLTDQAAAEEAARKTAAQTAYENTKRGWENTTQQREQQIQDLETQSARETAAQVGPAPTTTGMGEDIIGGVRDAHQALQARKNAEYADAYSREGTVYDPAVVSVRGEVQAALKDETLGSAVDISPSQTPVANEMLGAVKKYAKQARKRLMEAGEGEQTGQSLQDIESFRKDLSAKYNNADTPADQRAASRIMQGVDRWQEGAMGGPHYEGDPGALAAMRQARATNAEIMNRFGYNHRYDEDKITQKIIRGGPTEHIGPNEIADLLHAKPDKAGRVLDRVFEATGPNPDLQQSIRGGMYNRASEAVREGQPRTPEAIAADLRRLTSGSREGLAGRIYQPEDIALIRRHAAAVDAAQRARDLTPKIAKATEPKLIEPEIGPAQQLAKAVIGGGQKGDEALVRQILGYATSKGSPADIRKLADILRNVPESTKKELLNTFIRQLGQGADGKFSPKIFADAWQRHISPQAKTLLTGSGEHAKTLDNLAGIARQYDEVHRKFGNPSGSGTVMNFTKSLTTMASLMASGTFLGPVATIAGWLGVAGYSRFLAAPAGASSAAKFARQMAKFQANPTVAQAGATRLAARNLRNTAIGLGISVSGFPEPPKK